MSTFEKLQSMEIAPREEDLRSTLGQDEVYFSLLGRFFLARDSARWDHWKSEWKHLEGLAMRYANDFSDPQDGILDIGVAYDNFASRLEHFGLGNGEKDAVMAEVRQWAMEWYAAENDTKR